ncbi:MAG: hypothetical protein KJ571_02840 [Bacteroidetes bacterium]|nr:hypothetical protein [Bacteroidota bacterium]
MNKKYDELKCIWADSGIIGYKLCDKQFDCENCELDKVLRKTANLNTELENKAGRTNNILNNISSEIKTLTYDKHYYYLKNFLCIKNLFGDKYFLGISPLLYSLFLNSESNFNCVNDYFVNSGDKIALLSGDWGSIDIASPLAMKVLKQIPKMNGENYSVNWIGIVELENNDVNAVSIDSEKFEMQKKLVLTILKSKQFEYSNADCTMYDGGNKVKNLTELLGKKEFNQFINDIIKISA